MSKAGYSIKSITTKAAVVTVDDKDYSFPLDNKSVLDNLIMRGVKRYMDAAKAGKEGADVAKALTSAASDMAQGKIGRGSFDVKAFTKAVAECKELTDIADLNKQVASAPQKVRADMAQLVVTRTIEIATA